MNILNISAITSLVLQVITGIIEAYGLTFKVKNEDQIVKDILAVELIVQVIEFIFYVYIVYKILFSHLSTSITSHRYLDWNLTTPIMLINFIVFFKYLNNETKQEKYIEIIKKESQPILQIVFANFLMLLAGYLGEIGVFNLNITTAVGFIPFAYIFKQVYSNYVKDNTNILSSILFYFVFLIWGFYGIAAVLPFQLKNTFYNILDLFAKNAYGLFLFFYLNFIKL